MDEEEGIYRGEVLTVMGILADIYDRVEEIATYLMGDDDDEWEEEEEPPDA